MASNPRRANGHRRSQLRRRVLREEDVCWLCGAEVDKSLGLMPDQHSPRCVAPDCGGCVPHPMSPEVDEVVPVSLGGDPLDRSNCRLAHRRCNRARSNGTSKRKPLVEVKRVRQW